MGLEGIKEMKSFIESFSRCIFEASFCADDSNKLNIDRNKSSYCVEHTFEVIEFNFMLTWLMFFRSLPGRCEESAENLY